MMPHALARAGVWRDLGVVPYEAALQEQWAVHRAVVAGVAPPTVLVCEHPSTITFGRHANHGFLQTSAEVLAAAGIAVVASDRGGEVTAHTPGQVVLYPIIPLRAWGIEVRGYVQALEAAAIAVLSRYGIIAARRAQYPGVWVGNCKLAAVGVRVQQRVSLHGLALNVAADLSVFHHIVPCGIPGSGVGNLVDYYPPSSAPIVVARLCAQIRTELVAELARHLDLQIVPGDTNV